MNPKIDKGGRGRIQYLLRCAFTAADEGDAVEAMHFWRTAIEEGYDVKEKTHRQLLFRIREGEKSSLAPGADKAPAASRLPEPKPLDIVQRIAIRRKTTPEKLD